MQIQRLCRFRVALIAIALAACTAQAQPTPGTAHAGPGSGGVNRTEHVDAPYILLISLDGFRADYLDRFDLPNVRRVVQRGARARAMIPVFPSTTFPNHYSLVTGLHPERHGIVNNAFYDPERQAAYSFRNTGTVQDGSWYRGEPIWVTAERQGMVTGCFFWPGSEAAIQGVRPTFWSKYDAHVANADRVETVLKWLRLPAERRPHVITVYFSDVDRASHGAPLDSPSVGRAAQSLDRVLGRLLDGIATLSIKDRVYLLLTSDHGMAETSRAQTLRLSSLIDMAGLRVGYSGPVTGLHVRNRSDAPRVRDTINARLHHGRAYLREEMPERYHYRADPRVGDLVIVMEEGWTVQASMVNRALIQDRWGEHGWDPAFSSMQALFVIAGPGIRAGVTVPDVDTIDVYPLMTELLGLRPAENIDGRKGHLLSLISEPKALPAGQAGAARGP